MTAQEKSFSCGPCVPDRARYVARVNETPFKYRGRVFTEKDVAQLNEIITAHPEASRRALSTLVCEALDWRQENGQLRDMVCRSAMLALHRGGKITLPPVRWVSLNNAIRHRETEPVLVDQTPMSGSIADLGPIEMHEVRRTADERIFNGLLLGHHYLAYTRPVGEHLKYLVFAQGRPIACVAWSSAPRHLAPRDRFIGWAATERRKNTHLIAYNTRFLILPWVKVPHLASHLLGRMARRLAADWERAYGHPVVYLETFIDPARFQGTCYRAANWLFLGPTTGRGHNARTKICDKPKKEVLGYPLRPDFRAILGGVA